MTDSHSHNISLHIRDLGIRYRNEQSFRTANSTSWSSLSHASFSCAKDAVTWSSRNRSRLSWHCYAWDDACTPEIAAPDFHVARIAAENAWGTAELVTIASLRGHSRRRHSRIMTAPESVFRAHWQRLRSWYDGEHSGTILRDDKRSRRLWVVELTVAMLLVKEEQ